MRERSSVHAGSSGSVRSGTSGSVRSEGRSTGGGDAPYAALRLVR
jgi:hypothetical protein